MLWGGVILFWNDALWHKLDEFVGRFSVSILLHDVRSNVEWVASSIYGPTVASDREDFWLELSAVAGRWNCPWVLGGDFNLIRFPNEKRGGCLVLQCGLLMIGFDNLTLLICQ